MDGDDPDRPHFYNADTFNEMNPKSSARSYLDSVGKSTFKAMVNADPQAVWVLQGWAFQTTFGQMHALMLTWATFPTKEWSYSIYTAKTRPFGNAF